MHVEIPRLRNATELNNDGMNKLVDVHYQTEQNFSIFWKFYSAMTPVSVLLFFQQLTCSVMFFPFEKLLLKSVFVCDKWRHLHVTMLQC